MRNREIRSAPANLLSEVFMRERGKIKWFKRTAGYGFIVPNSGGPDVMLHASLCNQLGFTPLDSMSVEFEAAQTQTGWKAVWVGEGNASVF